MKPETKKKKSTTHSLRIMYYHEYDKFRCCSSINNVSLI
jgi:hypothetical protein